MVVADTMEVDPPTLLELPEELIGLILIASGGVGASRASATCGKLRTIAAGEALWASICSVAGLGGALLTDAADHNRGGAVDWRRLVQLAHRCRHTRRMREFKWNAGDPTMALWLKPGQSCVSTTSSCVRCGRTYFVQLQAMRSVDDCQAGHERTLVTHVRYANAGEG